MPYEGQCICGNVRLILPQQPPSSLRCHCRNCSRSGGSSINFVIDDADVVIKDPQCFIKRFEDAQTDSGNRIERHFCGNCGRAGSTSGQQRIYLSNDAWISPIFTSAPAFVRKKIVNASLFDTIPLPAKEVYTHRRHPWEYPVDGPQQFGK